MPTYVLQHLPKCGGNTVAALFRFALGDAAVVGISATAIGSTSQGDVAPYEMVHGHFERADLSRLVPGAHRIVVVRELTSRILSLFRFLPQIDEDSSLRTFIMKRSFERFVDDAANSDEFRSVISNQQSQMVTGMSLEALMELSSRRLSATLDAALSDFAVVGDFGAFQETLDLISGTYALPRFPAAIKYNRTRSTRAVKIQPALAQKLAALNSIDSALYQRPQVLFQRQRERMMDKVLSANALHEYRLRSHYPDNVEIGVADFMAGVGWYELESNAEGIFYRWVGGAGVASLVFLLAPAGKVAIDVEVEASTSDAALEAAFLRFDGVDCPTAIDVTDTGVWLRAQSLTGTAAPGFTHQVEIVTPVVRDAVLEDDRNLAIAIRRVLIRTHPDV